MRDLAKAIVTASLPQAHWYLYERNDVDMISKEIIPFYDNVVVVMKGGEQHA